MTLSTLEPVDLRTEWPHEEEDFTPWLEDNIDFLAKALDLEEDLEVDSREERIGRYKADLICSSQAGTVIVENQLDEADHRHLGQVLVYAAGIDASIVVWIAKGFTDEHRAAIDWLNRVTKEIDFFAMEIELWQIGDSDRAPKLNIVSAPNDWSRTVRAQVSELTPAKQLYLEYWTTFRKVLDVSGGPAKGTKPLAESWMNIAVGRTGFQLEGTVSTQKGRIQAGLYMKAADSIRYFEALKEDRSDIESELEFALDWQPLHGKKACRIAITKNFDPEDKSSWPEQHRWLADHLNRMHEVLAPRVRSLEALPDKKDESEDG